MPGPKKRVPLPVCEQCPWRLANQGRPHPLGLYTKRNLTRLWNLIRRGTPQSCHLAGPTRPGHAEAGCPPDPNVRECPGSVILVLREVRLLANGGGSTAGSLDRYLKRRRRGLTRNGAGYWLSGRYLFGGIPHIGAGELPEVDVDHAGVALPEYLAEG